MDSSKQPRAKDVPSRNRSGTLNKGLQYIKDKILPALLKRREAFEFMEAVDPVKQKLPDYSKIIEHPMDFSVIRGRLYYNFYQSSKQCLEDFQLVFNNAYMYFPRCAPAVKKAKALETVLLRLLDEMPKDEEVKEELTKHTSTAEPVAGTSRSGFTRRFLPENLRGEANGCGNSGHISSTTHEDVFKVPPPPKRRRSANVAKDVPIGNGKLPSYVEASIEASSSNNRGNTAEKEDWSDFEIKYRNEQLMCIKNQMKILEEQLKVWCQYREQEYTAGTTKLLDRQCQISQEQKEWLEVQSMEEYELKKQQHQKKP